MKPVSSPTSGSWRHHIPLIATVSGVLVTSTLVLNAACGSDTPAKKSDSIDSGAPSSSSGENSSGFQTGGTPDAGPPPACVAKEAEAIEGKRPVDIIFVIDNSSSMAGEIAEVEDQINTNFANIIDASGVDYRVIMLSNHGAHAEVNPDGGGESLQRICVKAPLSGTSCSPIPDKPAETAKFVHHNIVINSTDAFCQILESFNGPDRDGNHPQGWAPFLRPTAFKMFAVITDDHVSTSCNGFTFEDSVTGTGASAAGTFDSALFGLSPQFGNATRRNYVWHSIIGLAPFDSGDLTKPYPADAGVTLNQCSPGSEAPGTGYQALSSLTGGLRYPSCGLNYTTIFQAMAKGVIDNAVLACDYAMPANPAGGTIDPATAVVRYTSGTTVTDFERIPNATSCAPGKFYIEGDRIKLCPDACLKVQTDPAAEVKILFGCLPKEQK